MRTGQPKYLLALVAALAFWALPPSTSAHHELPSELDGVGGALEGKGASAPSAGSPLDIHSPNMSLVGNFDDGGEYRLGADEAFWGNLAVLSSYDEPGGFRLVNVADPRKPRQVGLFECPGPQNDVSVWQSLVFVSVDSPRSSPDCGAGGAATTSVLMGDREAAWEGIRIVDISDRKNPRQIKTVYTDCGSHTHTLVPDEPNDRVFIYVSSYPLTSGIGPRCNHAGHSKISVIEVPLANPQAARVVSTPNVGPAVGCHDITVYLERDLAGAACITESQLWDISDRAEPRVISHIVNPLINIHHSTTFSWDAQKLVIGDELGGAAASPGCPGGDKHLPLGSLWFYDVSDPAAPAPAGSFRIPQQQADSIFCTAHNFNTVPLRDTARDVLVTGWYNGGTHAVDFTDPSDPQQLAYYIARGGTQSRPDAQIRSASWSSYFYNGYVFANNFDEDVNSLTAQSRGLDVFRIDDPAFRKAARFSRLNAQTMEHAP